MYSILVADDDRYIRECIGALLINEGYNLKTAHNAKDIIAELQNTTYDAMVLDAHIDGIGTMQLLSIIKQIVPVLPIIIITGDSSIELEREIRSVGVYYYLIKPFKINELREVVGSAVHRHVSRGEQHNYRFEAL
jgi:DNA-binding NtrC family response regulator